ncbi:MAG TPA: hypothetical protein PKD53_27730 [Chloroflexaceae bacterium]|nr:hypothetical protein [Chloroflexaceae bacterium]
MGRRRRHGGDNRHLVIDHRELSRTRKLLGLIAAVCLVAAFLIPQLQGLLLMVGLFSGVAIGWVE